jgi:hypothetical protein
MAILVSFSGSAFGQEKPLAQPVELASTALFPAAPSAAFSGADSGIAVAAVAPLPFVTVSEPAMRPEAHAFWDRQNKVLFGAVAAAATADFFTTRANLANGGHELNPLTRVLSGSTPGLAVNFGLETAASVGLSYFFHKTGHHGLERMTSMVNIGASIGAVTYGQTHR